MGAAAGGLNSLREQSDGTAPLENPQHILYTHKVRLVKIFGDNAKRYKQMIKSFFENVLVAANNVDIMAPKAINGVNKFQP